MGRIPTVEYCCCGTSLKLGTVAIGIFALIGSIGGFIGTLDSYIEFDEVMNQPDLDNPRTIQIREHTLAVKVFLYENFLQTISGIILATLLLIGFCSNNRYLLRTWVLGTLVFQILAIFFNSYMCIIFGEYLYMLYNLSVFLNLYFMCVVNSYAQEMIKGSSSSIA